MPKCSRLKKKKQQVCIGDLRDEITIQDRDIAPAFTGTNFREVFSNNKVRSAMVNTVKGKTFFDSVGIGTNITHEITFRFDSVVTAENWILFKGNHIDILELTNLDERDDWLMAICVDRGDATKAATEA